MKVRLRSQGSGREITDAMYHVKSSGERFESTDMCGLFTDLMELANQTGLTR